MLKYPLDLRFKLLTFGQRITATDAEGRTLMFIKQKMFKLKEKVEIYSDTSQSNLIFTLQPFSDIVLTFPLIPGGSGCGGERYEGVGLPPGGAPDAVGSRALLRAGRAPQPVAPQRRR